MVHIGKEIHQKLQEDERTATWFAGKICCSRSHVYRIFANANIDIILLSRICKVLNYNFFKILYEDCNKELS